MKKRPVIGMMLGNINVDFTVELAHGIYKYAHENNADTVVLMSAPVSNLLGVNNIEDIFYNTIYDNYKFLDLDVLIVTYASLYSFHENEYNQKFLEKFKDIPIVLLQDDYVNGNNSTVTVDNEKGFVECLEHLIKDHGYKNLCYVSGPKNNYDSIKRKEIFENVCSKHDIKITDKQIVYGDFTENVDENILTLLENNKNIDAIVFANDTMAIASYAVLEKHGYEVGKDIAVTGFDNLDTSVVVHPALTTVSQDPVRIGYEGAKEALNLINKKQFNNVVLDTKFVKRNSCGCVSGDNIYVSNETDKDKIVKDVINYVITNSKMPISTRKLHSFVDEIIELIIKNVDNHIIFDILKNKIKSYSNNNIIYCNVLERVFITVAKNILFLYPEYTDKINSIIIDFQDWFFHYVNRLIVKESNDSKNNTIATSYIIQRMINNRLSINETIEYVFDQLKLIDVKSCYIYLFKDVKKKKISKNWKIPDSIYLSAYYDSKETIIYKNNERIKVSFKEKLEILKNKDSFAYSLFSGESQYGFIVCEGSFKLSDSIQSLLSQLSMMFYVKEILDNENKYKNKLISSLNVIESKNIILNNLSLYDELTNIYNRRGLIEKSLDLINNSDNKMFEIIFADLDHLKEINDTFGHKEGDYAIVAVSNILKSTLPDGAIVGRLGGDEFIGLYEIKNKRDSKNIENTLKKNFKNLNSNSKKPYYINASIGRFTFNSNTKIEISTLFDKADKYLYEAKKKRRNSVRKK